MINPSAKRKTIFICFAFIVIAMAIHFGLLMNGFYGISADESGRTLDAYTWLKTGTPYSDVWLPFHRLIVAAGLFFWNDLILIPRIISCAFGLFALFAIIWMAHELFHDHRVTAVTGILASLFPPRIILSVVPLTEIEFIAFIITGLVFYIRWLQSKNRWQLFATALCIGISTTIRYEAWIFAVVFSLLLLLRREYRTIVFGRSVVGYFILLLLAAFPLYWTAIKFQETHQVLSFASSHADRYQRIFHISALKIIWHNPITQFLYQNGQSLNLVGILSLVPLFRFDKQKRKYLLLPILAMILFAFVLLTGAGFTTHNPWRISVLWGCLLLPFTAQWIVQNLERYKSSTIVKRYGALVLLFIAFAAQLVRLSRAPEFNSSDYETGKFLKQELQRAPRQKILIETSDWNFINVLVAAGAPDNMVFNSGFDPYEPTNAILPTKAPVDAETLTQQKLRLLVFHSPLIFSRTDMQNIKQVFRTPRWTVYELHESALKN